MSYWNGNLFTFFPTVYSFFWIIEWPLTGKDCHQALIVSFAGPFGHSQAVKARANKMISLSNLVLNHQVSSMSSSLLEECTQSAHSRSAVCQCLKIHTYQITVQSCSGLCNMTIKLLSPLKGYCRWLLSRLQDLMTFRLKWRMNLNLTLVLLDSSPLLNFAPLSYLEIQAAGLK